MPPKEQSPKIESETASQSSTNSPTPSDAATDVPDLAWDALLSTASFEEASDKKARASVNVPDAVLAKCKEARAARQRIILPYTPATFQQICDVFYSAGDLLEPKASVQITRVNAVGKVVKDDTAVKVRIFVGDRRGSKEKKAPEKPAEAVADPQA